MAVNTYEFEKNVVVIEALGISPSEVLEDGFIHPEDNGGIVEFQQLIRNEKGGIVTSGCFHFATRTRRFNMETGKEVL